MGDDRLALLARRVDRILDEQRKLDSAKERGKRARAAGGGMVVDAYLQWRYEHPAWALLVQSAAGVLIVCGCVMLAWWSAGTALGRETGLHLVRERMTNAYYAVRWSMGVGDISGEERMDVVPRRYRGTIDRAINDILLVTLYVDGKQVRRLVKPANVAVMDRPAFKAWAQTYQFKGVAFDLYGVAGEMQGHKVWSAVLWHRKTPINVSLVEQGVGVPEKAPPTPVVNTIFSQYYWGLAAGKVAD